MYAVDVYICVFVVTGLAARENLIRAESMAKHPFRMSSMNEQTVYVVDGGAVYPIAGTQLT